MQDTTESIEPLPATAPEALVSEIERYLEAVTLFRELGHGPSWRAEAPPVDLAARTRRWLEPRESRISSA